MSKPVIVTARVRLDYQGTTYFAGDVFTVTPTEALTLAHAQQVSLTRKASAKKAAKPARPRTYRRRDVVAED